MGQILSNNLNGGSRTIAYQQGLFLNAFALIEFFKAVLRLIFCPRYPDLRPFPVSDVRARYWHTRLSWLSGVIGYGLLVVVPIVSNQINVQVGALVNVVIMGLMTGWALWLIFHNRRRIQRELIALSERSLSFSRCLSAPSPLSGTGSPAPILSCSFSSPSLTPAAA